MPWLQVPVERPANLETTSLGAAYAAGIGVGFWSEEWVFKEQGAAGGKAASWQPKISAEAMEKRYAKWHKAVELSLDLAHFTADPE